MNEEIESSRGSGVMKAEASDIDVGNQKEEQTSSTTDTECTTNSSTNTKSDVIIPAKPEPQTPEAEGEATFPLQLWDLIESETVDDNAATINGRKAIEWIESGEQFVIRDKETVEKCVLPKYFKKKSKFMSFVRKLYRWGFRQDDNASPNIMIFMHPNFIRGDKERCLAMRSKVKKPSAPAAASITGTNSPSNKRQKYGETFPSINDPVGVIPHELLWSRNLSAMYGGGLGYGGSLGAANHPGFLPAMNYGVGSLMWQPNPYSSGVLMQPRQGYNMIGPINNSSISSNSSSTLGQGPFAAAAIATANANQDYNDASNQQHSTTGDISNSSRPPANNNEEVELASIIMSTNPTMDARQALHRAKNILSSSSISSTATDDKKKI